LHLHMSFDASSFHRSRCCASRLPPRHFFARDGAHSRSGGIAPSTSEKARSVPRYKWERHRAGRLMCRYCAVTRWNCTERNGTKRHETGPRFATISRGTRAKFAFRKGLSEHCGEGFDSGNPWRRIGPPSGGR
jgi:hypothetical protein